MADAVISTVVLLPASTTQRLPLVSKASPTGFVKWVILGQPPDWQEELISTTPGEYADPVPLLATQGVVPVVVTETGLENPKKVLQVEQEKEAPTGISVTDPCVVSLVTQMSLLESTAIPVGEVNPEKVGQEEGGEEQVVVPKGIFVTDPGEVSFVTQMLFLESTAIPAGPKPKGNSGQSEAVAQEVVPAGISIRPVLVVTQTLFWLSIEIFPKEVSELVPVGGEKEVEGGGLPPVPPPPVPQAGRDKRKIMRMNMRPARSNFCLIRFSPNL